MDYKVVMTVDAEEDLDRFNNNEPTEPPGGEE